STHLPYSLLFSSSRDHRALHSFPTRRSSDLAACAARLAERLTSVLLVCSMGPTDTPEAMEGMVPLNRWLQAFARNAPWIAQRAADRKSTRLNPVTDQSRMPSSA